MDKLLTSHPKRAAVPGRQGAPATLRIPSGSMQQVCGRRGRAASQHSCGAAVREDCNYRHSEDVSQGHEPLSYVNFPFFPTPPISVVFCGLLCSGLDVTLNMKVIYKTLMYLNKSLLPKSTFFKYPLQPNTCDKPRIILFWCSLLLFTCNENLFHMKILLCLKLLQHENSNLALLELTLVFGKQFSRQKGLQQHPFGLFPFVIDTIAFQIQTISA